MPARKPRPAPRHAAPRAAAGAAALASLASSLAQPTTNPDAASPTPHQAPAPQRFEPDLSLWWNRAVFYQVFVRSFADATHGPASGDGIGDLDGLLERLDDLNDARDGAEPSDRSLGITALWLMPIMESPSYHGYDIADYKKVRADYGGNPAFLRFMAEAKRRNIRVILDLVPNHCSWQHPWFKDAVKPASPTRDWFVWQSSKPAWKGPWNQEVWHPWPAARPEGPGGDLEGTQGYYYGIFWKGMPDLNYRNPAVTDAMNDVVRWWMLEEKQGGGGGVDGYRIDAIRHLIEEDQLQESTPSTHRWLQNFHTFYKGVKKDAFTVGEVWAETDQVVPYIGRELDSCFEFHTAYATIDAINEGSRAKLDKQWEENLSKYPRGQYSTFLSNHDQERVMSRFGGGDANSSASPADAWAKSKLAATLLLTSPGIPFLYYGEEIGMVGKKPDEDIRTPMQWTSAPGAGFSTADPWRPVNKDAPGKNVDAQQKDPQSLLNLYKKLIRLRRGHDALSVGTMALCETTAPQVYAFVREQPGGGAGAESKFVVIANLSGKKVRDYGVKLPAGFADATARVSEELSGIELKKPGARVWKPTDELPARGVLVIRVR